MSESAPDKNDSRAIIPTKEKVYVQNAIKTFLPTCPVPDHYRVPNGWMLDESGLYFHGEEEEDNARMASAYPIVITKKLIDLEENSEKLEVTFLVEGEWRTVAAPREVFANTSKIIALATYGLPVTSLNARHIVSYLYEMEVFNKIYRTFTVTRCGWKEFKGKTLFVLGSQIIGAENGEIRFEAAGSGEDQAVRALKKAGDLDGWLGAIDKVAHETPLAMMAIYHALTPPLMKICGAPNYCVDVSGTSSIGKTTFARLGASVWGAAYVDGELIKSWNSTKVFAERWLSINCDLPAFLDETHLAKEDVLSSVVYMVINGVGRGRGSLKGVQETKSWSTCLFSTGEVPISSSSQMEGIRARVVPYWGSPFGGEPKKALINTLERTLAHHHGHIGPLFLKRLIDEKASWPSIKARYEVLAEKLAKTAKGNVAGRVTAYMALTWVAAELFHDLLSGFFDPDFKPATVMQAAFDQVTKEFEEIPLWKRGFEAVIAWYLGNKQSFLTQDGGMDIENRSVKEHFGLVREVGGKEEICILQHSLQRFLKQENFPYHSLLRAWKDKGVTRCQDGLTLPVKFKGSVIRMVALPMPDSVT